MTGQTEQVDERDPQAGMSEEDIFAAEVARRRGVAVEDLESFSDTSTKAEEQEGQQLEVEEEQEQEQEQEQKQSKAPKNSLNLRNKSLRKINQHGMLTPAMK